MHRLLIAALLALTACGAAGPPVKPSPESAVTVTGDVTLGVSTKIN